MVCLNQVYGLTARLYGLGLTTSMVWATAYGAPHMRARTGRCVAFGGVRGWGREASCPPSALRRARPDEFVHERAQVPLVIDEVPQSPHALSSMYAFQCPVPPLRVGVVPFLQGSQHAAGKSFPDGLFLIFRSARILKRRLGALNEMVPEVQCALYNARLQLKHGVRLGGGGPKCT